MNSPTTVSIPTLSKTICISWFLSVHQQPSRTVSRVSPACFSPFQPSEKRAEIAWIDVVEPTAIPFDLKSFRNTNGVRPEVIEVPRDKGELVVLLKIAKGAFGLFLVESAVGEVLASRKFFIHPHCVYELSMSRASSSCPAGTYNPISLARQFFNVLGFLIRAAAFTPAKRTHFEIGVWSASFVMVNNVGVNLHLTSCVGFCMRAGRRRTTAPFCLVHSRLGY